MDIGGFGTLLILSTLMIGGAWFVWNRTQETIFNILTILAGTVDTLVAFITNR